MPLDLSPLATPIIRSKIEEPSVVETTHQDSPLPHPESTTSDEKVRAVEKITFHAFVIVCICGCAWHVEGRGQLVGISSLLTLCSSQGLSSGFQAW